MHRSLFVLVLFLAVHGVVCGQTPLDVLERLQEIRLLESDRHDVRRVLADYVATDNDRHYQRFSVGDVSIRVFYSTGTCPKEVDDKEPELYWTVSEWKVTSIKIVPATPFAPENIGLDLRGFTKEQIYTNIPNEFIQHSKKLGIAFEMVENGISSIILIPPKGNEKQLCNSHAFAKTFYVSDSWFIDSNLQERSKIPGNSFPMVIELDLSTTEISATSDRIISVSAKTDLSEDDGITYSYEVSGGRIRGKGAKVIWDLTGVPPGTYTISAGVDDGCGLCGKTATKSVVIK